MQDSEKTLMSAYDSRHLMRIKAGDPHQYTSLSLLTHGLSESPKSQWSKEVAAYIVCGHCETSTHQRTIKEWMMICDEETVFCWVPVP
jgi:hypothetical protein